MIRKTLRKFISLTMALVMIFSSSLIYAPILAHGWTPESTVEEGPTYTIVDGQNILPVIMEDVLEDYPYGELDVSILLKDQNTLLEGFEVKLFDVTTAGAIWIEFTGEPHVGSIRTIEINSTNGLSPREDPYELVAIIKCSDHEETEDCFDIEFAWHPLETIYLQVLSNSAPEILTDKVFSLDEDSGLTNITLGNAILYDADDDDIDLTAARIREATTGGEDVGSISFLGKNIAYTPAPDYNGTFEIVYDVEDEHGLGPVDGSGIVVVTVDPINDPPIALDDTAETSEETLVAIDVLANDSDDEYGLTIISVGVATHGLAEINAGIIEYTPEPGFSGSDTFSYTIKEDGGADLFEATATVTVSVIDSGDPNALVLDDILTSQDTAGFVDVLLNDTINNGAVNVTVGPATEGVVAVTSFDGVEAIVTYTPNPGYYGSDSFLYYVEDYDGYIESETVNVEVTNVLDTILANNDMLVLLEDTDGTVNVVYNDIVEEGFLSIEIIDGPYHGDASVVLGTSINYIPDDNYVGEDYITYELTDEQLQTRTAMVDIDVLPNDSNWYDFEMLLWPDELRVNEGETAFINVLENDIFLENVNVEDVQVYGGPYHGTAQINASGELSYTAHPSYDSGYVDDILFYEVESESGNKAIGMVFIKISEVDNMKLQNDDRTVDEDSDFTEMDVLENDFVDEGVKWLKIETFSDNYFGPYHGEVYVLDNKIFYKPDLNFNGEDQLLYKVKDNDWNYDYATLEITVLPMVDEEQDLGDHEMLLSVNEVGVINVLDEAESNSLSDPASIVVTETIPANGTADAQLSGLVTFTPEYNNITDTAFDYIVTDIYGDVGSGTITVIISDDVPSELLLANNDMLVLLEDTEGTANVIYNDIYKEGFGSIVITDGPYHGFAEVVDGDFEDSSIRYVPDPNYVGEDYITYELTDLAIEPQSMRAMIDIDVIPNNSNRHDFEMMLWPDNLSVGEGEIGFINVLDNDYFHEGAEPVNIQITDGPYNGTAQINASGQLSYTAHPTYDFFLWFIADDILFYEVTTQSGNKATGMVLIWISEVDNLKLQNDDRTVDEDSGYTEMDVLENDLIDEGVRRMEIEDFGGNYFGPYHGEAYVSNNKIYYMPDPNFNGVDQLLYKVKDNDRNYDYATLEISVLAVEDEMIVFDSLNFDMHRGETLTFDMFEALESQTEFVADSFFDVFYEVEAVVNTTPAFGVATTMIDGTVTYIPGDNHYGSIAFNVTYTSIYGDQAMGTVFIDVDLPVDEIAVYLYPTYDDYDEDYEGFFYQQYDMIDLYQGYEYGLVGTNPITEEWLSINTVEGYLDPGDDFEADDVPIASYGTFLVTYHAGDDYTHVGHNGPRRLVINQQPLVSVFPIEVPGDEVSIFTLGLLLPPTEEVYYLDPEFNVLDYLYMYDFEDYPDNPDGVVDSTDIDGMVIHVYVDGDEVPLEDLWNHIMIPYDDNPVTYEISFSAEDTMGGESEVSGFLLLTVINNPPEIDVPQADYMGQGVNYITTGTTYNPWIGLLDDATDDVTYFDVEDDADIGQPFQEPQVTVKIWDGDEFAVQGEGALHWDTNRAGLYELTYLVTDFHGLTAEGVRYIEVNTIPYVDLMIDVENPNPYIVQVDDEFLTWHNIDFGDADNDPITLSYMIEEFDYGTSSFSTVDNVVLPVDELPDAITFDTSVPGLFYVEFGIEDFWEEIDVINRHIETDESRILYVNAPPEIVKADNPIYLTFGDEFDPLDFVTATDLEDDYYDIDLVIEYDAEEIDEPGKYMVDFTVYDSMGGMDEITLEVWFISNPVITVIPDHIMLEVDETLDPLDGVTAVDWLGESVDVEAYLDLEEDPITQVSSEVSETITVYYTAKTVIDEQEWSAEVKSREYEVYEKTVTAIPKTVSLHFGYGYSPTASVDLDATQYPEFAFTTPGAFTWTEESPYISVDSETGLVTVITTAVTGTVGATVEVEADGIVDDVVITITKHNTPAPTNGGSSSSSSSGSSSGSSRPKPRKVVLDTDAVTLDYGADADPAFTSYDFKETVTGTADKRVTWSLDDDMFVTVDRNGVVTAIDDIPLGQGDITVVLTVTMVDGGKTDTATILFLENNPLGAIEFYQPYIVGYPDGSFRPLNSITRAEAATMFTNMLNLNMEYPGTRAFNDVAPEHWAYKHIQAVIRTGIFVGYEDGSFKPEDPITRAEMAQLFSNYWKFAEIDVNGVQPAEIPDVPVTHWAADAINKMYNTGLFTGYDDGSYKPELPTLRKDVVVMINKLLGRPANPAAASKFTDILTTHPNFGDIEAASQVYVKPQLQE